MSRIGKSPITVPSDVTVTLDGQTLTVKGPKGELNRTLPRLISVKLEDSTLTVSRKNDAKPTKALHGLTRALIANMIEGVTQGFQKTLELVGTGYRAKMQGNKLVLSLGFSHEIEFEADSSVKITLEGNNVIHVSGYDKQLVGQTAANIRAFKKPEPYKGKGIRYQGEHIRRKAGKAAKAAA